MCGIVGYIGHRKAYPILIKGLKRLEYRGYDSAGVALISDSCQLNVYKTKGKVADLETFVSQKDISGTIGIAHTRWATHGEPCSANAHPHYSSSGRFALIHNGIIENYAVLKEKLQAKGYQFNSSTDTEVLVQLIETFCRIPVEVEYAPEFRYRDPVITSDDVVIAISRCDFYQGLYGAGDGACHAGTDVGTREGDDRRSQVRVRSARAWMWISRETWQSRLQ